MSILPLSLARFACYMMAHGGAEIQNGRKGKVFIRAEGGSARPKTKYRAYFEFVAFQCTKKLTLESYECQHFNVTSQVQWLRRGSS
jgi:hypothetical protein